MKNCPFCLEKIKYEAVKCKYCGEWFNKENIVEKDFDSIISVKNDVNSVVKEREKADQLFIPNFEEPITVNHVQLYPDRIIVGSESILINDIISIFYDAVESSYNFSTTRYLIFYVKSVKNPEKYYNLASIENDFNVFIQSTHDKKSFEIYALINKILNKQTVKTRLMNHLKLIETKGYYEYDNYLFYPDGAVVKNKKRDKIICNLFDAKNSNQIEWGVAWKGLNTRSYNPNQFRILNGKPSFKFLGFIETGIHLKISVTEDVDVFNFIMNHLLKTESFPAISQIDS